MKKYLVHWIGKYASDGEPIIDGGWALVSAKNDTDFILKCTNAIADPHLADSICEIEEDHIFDVTSQGECEFCSDTDNEPRWFVLSKEKYGKRIYLNQSDSQ